jgi:hypothetical protein
MGVEATAPSPPRPAAPSARPPAVPLPARTAPSALRQPWTPAPRRAAPSAPRWAVPWLPGRAPPPRPPEASAERAAAPSPEQAAWRPLASSVLRWRRWLSAALPGRPTQRCLAAAGRPRPQATAMRRRRWAVQPARDDQAAEPPGGGPDGTWLAPWRAPVQPPLGLRRAGLDAPVAAQTAPWRPREWAGPAWQREGPAVRPVQVAPPGPACPRPRPSCDRVS